MANGLRALAGTLGDVGRVKEWCYIMLLVPFM